MPLLQGHQRMQKPRTAQGMAVTPVATVLKGFTRSLVRKSWGISLGFPGSESCIAYFELKFLFGNGILYLLCSQSYPKLIPPPLPQNPNTTEIKSLFTSSYTINIGVVDFVHLIQYLPDFVLHVFIFELLEAIR